MVSLDNRILQFVDQETGVSDKCPTEANWEKHFQQIADQWLMALISGHRVDDAPEAGPAFEAAGFRVSGDWAGGGADYHHQLVTK